MIQKGLSRKVDMRPNYLLKYIYFLLEISFPWFHFKSKRLADHQYGNNIDEKSSHHLCSTEQWGTTESSSKGAEENLKREYSTNMFILGYSLKGRGLT